MKHLKCYGKHTVVNAAEFQWWRHFKDGNMRVIDKARSGRPSTAVTMSVLPRLRSCWKMTEG